MLRSGTRDRLGALLLTVVACHPRGTNTSHDGPSFTLDEATPEARVSVQLCMEGTDDHRYYPRAVLRAQVIRRAGTAKISLRAEPDAFSGHSQLEMPPPDDQAPMVVQLEAEGPWEEHDQLRCAAAQLITFTAGGLTEGASLLVEWDVQFEVHYGELGLCTEQIDPTLSIETARLTTTP